jgi:tetratricopeptide (TPR) repeat protein
MDKRSSDSQDSYESSSSTDTGSAYKGVFALLYVALLVACVVVWVKNDALAGEAFISMVVTVALFPVWVAASSRQAISVRTERSSQMKRVVDAIESMRRESGLSEAAKRVLHRREERNLLRQAIEQDIAAEDWDAAMSLVKELAERFGYRLDAEEFRARIEQARTQTLDRSVLSLIEKLDAHIADRQWDEAQAKAAKIVRLFPDSPRIDGLVERVNDSRHRYKLELERKFLKAAEREEIEQAMRLLKEMDEYLGSDEAEPFREVARGVIGKARDNLGVRFKLAIQDRAWPQALEVGERIMADFPNTRMADEVRRMIDTIRERIAAAPSSR